MTKRHFDTPVTHAKRYTRKHWEKAQRKRYDNTDTMESDSPTHGQKRVKNTGYNKRSTQAWCCVKVALWMQRRVASRLVLNELTKRGNQHHSTICYAHNLTE